MTKSRGRPKGSSNKAKTEKSLETNDQKKVKIEKQSSEFMIDLTQPKTAFKKPAELSQQSKSQDFITIDWNYQNFYCYKLVLLNLWINLSFSGCKKWTVYKGGKRNLISN